MQTKIPLLPPDWTLARGGKYLARLAVFILVPGLHQIACGRKVLGWMLFGLYLWAVLSLRHRPFDFQDMNQIPLNLLHGIQVIAQVFSWGLMAIDIRKTETRLFEPVYLVKVVSVAMVLLTPYPEIRKLRMFIQQEDQACPAFCKFDIIEFDMHLLRKHKISVDDHVVVHSWSSGITATKILAGPPDAVCETDGSVPPYLPKGSWFCRKPSNEIYTFHYLIRSDVAPGFKSGNYIMIPNIAVDGINPRKIGNTHEYFVLTDGVTEVVGNSLLFFYKWTGINLFGYSDRQANEAAPGKIDTLGARADD